MFYLAAFPQFITGANQSVTSSFLLVFLHSAINAVWFGAMVLLVSQLATLTRKGAFQRWLKGVTGVVFIWFGIKPGTSYRITP
jgi:threonine/homoserine/homoserine lactone efflux protein